MVRFRLLCGVFLLPNPAPNLDNRKTVCMGYTAMTPQGRAGKRRRKGAGKPCRENGTLNIKWSKWPPDWGNNTKRHSPETSSTLQLIPCGHFDHMEWTDVAQVNVFKLMKSKAVPPAFCSRTDGKPVGKSVRPHALHLLDSSRRWLFWRCYSMASNGPIKR